MSTQVQERVVYAGARGEPDLRPHTHLRVTAVAVLLLAWEAISRAGIFPRVFLPPPSAVAVELWRMAASGDLWRNVQPSLARILGGFAIGSAAGVALGTLAAVSVRAEAVIDPLVALAYPIPWPGSRCCPSSACSRLGSCGGSSGWWCAAPSDRPANLSKRA